MLGRKTYGHLLKVKLVATSRDFLALENAGSAKAKKRCNV
jgi:hypothetical protein